VNGELDEGGLAAIADLFSQLDSESSLFFVGVLKMLSLQH